MPFRHRCMILRKDFRYSSLAVSDDFLTLVITTVAANSMCKLELAAVVTA